MSLQCSGAAIGLSKEVFLYSFTLRVQQLGYEKSGMNKLPCKELTLSLSFSLSETVKVKKRISHNSGQFILVILLSLGKLKLTVLPLIIAVSKS